MPAPMILRYVWSFVVCLAIAGCAGTNAVSRAPAPVPVAAPAMAAAPLDRNLYRLNTGDRVRIDVYGEPDLTTEETLGGSGSISYPLLGRLQVSGMTARELEQSLTVKLKQGYLVNPSVRVSILQFRPIYVIGQVHRAGAYPYVEGLTIEKAIALAGGMTPIASSRKIYILREGAAQSAREHGELQTPVSPGDTIVVEESLF